MRYQFKCCGEFEINQPIYEDHRANCPKCGKEARRIFSNLQWIWKGEAYRSDGSKRPDSDYAPVMGG